MQNKHADISVLWDASHIWGYLLLNGLRQLNISFNVLSAQEIAEKQLRGKLLIVPGGSARAKSLALGEKGQKEIKKFVHCGGNYLGFCGGAGLALSTPEGLGLCTWKRTEIQERLLHHISGHLNTVQTKHLLVPENLDKAQLPVWFPGRFAMPENHSDVQVLSYYETPADDLYMSDLPCSMFPKQVIEDAYTLYGVPLTPHLAGKPAIITGNYGKGQYVLSYAHLETPDSPSANFFFSHLISQLVECDVSVKNGIAKLNLDALPILWEDTELISAYEDLKKIFLLGKQLNLFFERTGWLYGWKNSVAGIQLAHLRIAYAFLLAQKPNNKQLTEYRKNKSDFIALLSFFLGAVQDYLYAKRLSSTLPDIFSPHLLTDQQSRLFGKAMTLGGICGELVNTLENCAAYTDNK